MALYYPIGVRGTVCLSIRGPRSLFALGVVFATPVHNRTWCCLPLFPLASLSVLWIGIYRCTNSIIIESEASHAKVSGFSKEQVEFCAKVETVLAETHCGPSEKHINLLTNERGKKWGSQNQLSFWAWPGFLCYRHCHFVVTRHLSLTGFDTAT